MKRSDVFYDDAWICDPKKCPNCPKTICHDGFCYHTTEKNQRAKGIKRFIFFLEFLMFGMPSLERKLRRRRRKERRKHDH